MFFQHATFILIVIVTLTAQGNSPITEHPVLKEYNTLVLIDLVYENSSEIFRTKNCHKNNSLN